jgi:hypothetical protein
MLDIKLPRKQVAVSVSRGRFIEMQKTKGKKLLFTLQEEYTGMVLAAFV